MAAMKHFEFTGNDPLTVQLTNGETKVVRKGDVVTADSDWGDFFDGRSDFTVKAATKKTAAKPKGTSK